MKAAAIGATIGALLLVSPDLAGGGDSLTQRILDGHRIAILSLLGFLAIRFIAGPLSYSAGTPGGLFAPMLALGALSGLLFAWLINLFSSTLATELALPLVLVGMSSLFASVVRAPFTGIILVIEMTTVTSAALPMLAAGAGAVVIASLVRSPPIYDDLRERMLRADKAAKHPPSTQ
ncbi:chloride channel protein EriC [Mycobacteroides abscessus subsp. abscessus]|nr:chloride channel protein EriC [Mycobacteroides abscessus subsp. abscessus]